MKNSGGLFIKRPRVASIKLGRISREEEIIESPMHAHFLIDNFYDALMLRSSPRTSQYLQRFLSSPARGKGQALRKFYVESNKTQVAICIKCIRRIILLQDLEARKLTKTPSKAHVNSKNVGNPLALKEIHKIGLK
jgi:hypothetical protein